MTSLGCDQDRAINGDGHVLMCSKFKVNFITRVELFFLSLGPLPYMPNSTSMILRKL